MRWLDALGWFKWPSLLLVASPIAAYPYWLPEPGPAADCGRVSVQGRAFRVFRTEAGAFILRPLSEAPGNAPVLDPVEPGAFDAGGMVVDRKFLAGAALGC
jgi:hypothetical protein